MLEVHFALSNQHMRMSMKKIGVSKTLKKNKQKKPAFDTFEKKERNVFILLNVMSRKQNGTPSNNGIHHF